MHELARRGWRLARDGSTATALLRGDACEDEPAWEIAVLLTLGHPPRWTLQADAGGLVELGPDAARELAVALQETVELLRDWRGETPDDESD